MCVLTDRGIDVLGGCYSFRLALVEIGHNEHLTRDELITFGNSILAAKESEETIRKLIELFDANVPHPKGSDLLYYPEGFDGEGDDFPTVEKIVDRCLRFG